MHELSIAINIVKIASRQARAASAESVSRVDLDIGAMSGIEFDSLQNALSLAVKDTLLEGTEFSINRIEPLFQCLSCDNLYTPESVFGKCPECGSPETELIKGDELQIKSLIVE